MARVLVVDDQLCVRQLICDELVDEGYDVVTAPDARSVGLMLEKWDVDLVVLDLYLDGSEGWKLLRSVKKRYPKLPVIIFTAYDTFMDDARLKEADDYIVKSMDLDPLKKAISRSLIVRDPPGIDLEPPAERWRRPTITNRRCEPCVNAVGRRKAYGIELQDFNPSQTADHGTEVDR